MPRDSLRPPGVALFEAMGACAAGHPQEEVLSAAMNIVLNALRQNVSRRDEVIYQANELFGRSMELLLEHYDPVSNRRRSVVPFDQVISPAHSAFRSNFPRLGGKNGSS